MEPLGDGAILRRHRGDRGAHGAFPVRLVLQLSGARFHRGLFLGCESFFLVGALGGLLRVCLRAHRYLLMLIWGWRPRRSAMVGGAAFAVSGDDGTGAISGGSRVDSIGVVPGIR